MPSTFPPSQSHITLASIPPLENGDRLTRLEFERRYCNMPEVKKAELVTLTLLPITSAKCDTM